MTTTRTSKWILLNRIMWEIVCNYRLAKLPGSVKVNALPWKVAAAIQKSERSIKNKGTANALILSQNWPCQFQGGDREDA